MSSFSHPYEESRNENDHNNSNNPSGRIIDSILRGGRQRGRQSTTTTTNNNNQRVEVLPSQQQQQQTKNETPCLVLGLRSVHRYADLVCIGLSLLAYLLEMTLNAVLAIFGIGVGVGLVLGDSFRAALPLMPAHNHLRHHQAAQQQQHHQQQNILTMMTSGTTVTEERGREIDPTNNSTARLYPAQ